MINARRYQGIAELLERAAVGEPALDSMTAVDMVLDGSGLHLL